MNNSDVQFTTKFRLDLDPKRIIVTDTIDYGGLGEDPNNFKGVLMVTGPAGVIYNNTDFNNPDIDPGVSKESTIQINLPLDATNDYWVLKGQYTIKYTVRRTSDQVQYFNSNVYGFAFDEPAMDVDVDSGPYTAKLRSNDNTNYGDVGDIDVLSREHRIQYPPELSLPDIVTTQASYEVDPIYTKEWTVIVTTTVDYKQVADDLEYRWIGTKTVSHCVAGSCISSFYDGIKAMVDDYLIYDGTNPNKAQLYQTKLAQINSEWQLLDIAWMVGNGEQADEHSMVIQEILESLSYSVCPTGVSVQVTACPEWGGQGSPGSYIFQNGLTEAPAGTVELGGTVNSDITLTLGANGIDIVGSSGGDNVLLDIDADDGLLLKGSDASYEKHVLVKKDELSLKHIDVGTPANNKTYQVAGNGIVEAADYSGDYINRSLIAKDYAEASFLSTANGTINALSDKATPIGADVVLIEDSEASYAQKKATITNILGVTGFIDLSDTPGSYTGSEGYVVRVNATPDELEFYDLSGDYISTTDGTVHGLTYKGTPVSGDVLLLEDSAASYAQKYTTIGDLPGTASTFIGLTDTPGSYSGEADKVLMVNSTPDAVVFVTPPWVDSGGGIFTGLVTITGSVNALLKLQQTDDGGIPGTPEAGQNYIEFLDSDGDIQGFFGINATGDLYLKTNIAGKAVNIDNNIVTSGTVDGVDIAAFKTAYDSHTHAFKDLSDAPSSYSGESLKMIRVKSDETGLEFVVSGSGTYWSRDAGNGNVYPAASGDDIAPHGTANIGLSTAFWANGYISTLYLTTSEYITEDNGDLEFTDTNTGTKTLAQLVQDTTYSFIDSLNLSGSNVNLDGDTASPGNNYYYGTNASGTKGFYALPAETTFIGLTDTPSSYTGEGGKVLRVNATPDAVEFVTVADLMADLTDTASGGLADFTYDGSSAVSIALDFTTLTNGTALADADEFAYYDSGVGMRALRYSAVKTALNSDLSFISSVDGTVHGLTYKDTPVSGDVLLIEDSAASYAQKYTTIGDIPGGGSTFLSLTDTPGDYTGDGGKVLRVNATPDAVEFVTVADLMADLTDLTNGGVADFTYDGSGAVSIGLDFTNLTNETVLADADEFAYYDSGVGMRALLYSVLKTALNSDLAFLATANGTVHSLSYKDTPVSGDVLLIEDSAASYAQKYTTVGDLPGGGVTLSGSTNNTICTVTGTDAIIGEQYFTWDGLNILSIGDAGGSTYCTAKIIAGSSGNATLYLEANSLANQIYNSGGTMVFQTDGGVQMQIYDGGTVALNYNHVLKFQTSSLGVTVNGIANITQDIRFTEQAAHSSTPTDGYGYLWVKSDTPSSLIFTDDIGTDYDLTRWEPGTYGYYATCAIGIGATANQYDQLYVYSNLTGYVGLFENDNSVGNGVKIDINTSSASYHALFIVNSTGTIFDLKGDGSLTLTGDFLPGTDGSYDLGNATYRLGEIHADHYMLDETPDVDDTGTGFVISATVDQNTVGVGGALKKSADSNFDDADYNASSTMPCIAIALESGTGTKKLLLVGFIRNAGWSWTVGGLIYVGTSGVLTQTTPSGSGDFVQVVGVATSATEIYFNPDLAMVEIVLK